MGRQLQPVPPPGIPLVTVDAIREAAACQDCVSELYFIPMHGPVGTVFGTYTAHDETCPAMKAATQRGQQQS